MPTIHLEGGTGRPVKQPQEAQKGIMQQPPPRPALCPPPKNNPATRVACFQHLLQPPKVFIPGRKAAQQNSRAGRPAPPPPKPHQGLHGWEGLEVLGLGQLGDEVLRIHADLGGKPPTLSSSWEQLPRWAQGGISGEPSMGISRWPPTRPPSPKRAKRQGPPASSSGAGTGRGRGSARSARG